MNTETIEELLKGIEAKGQTIVSTEEEREASRKYNEELSRFIHPPFGVINEHPNY